MKDSCFNQKALSAIHSALSLEIIVIISTFKTAKEAVEILDNNYEGNKRVKHKILQQLTTQFGAFKMDEKEIIFEFYSKLLSLSNECFSLGEHPSEAKLVRKILRSLPDRFDYKATAIEEAQDMDNITANELILDHSGRLR